MLIRKNAQQWQKYLLKTIQEGMADNCLEGSKIALKQAQIKHVNLDYQNEQGQTLLTLLAGKLQTSRFVALLIEAGASLEICNLRGKTALQEACYHQNYLVVEELIKAGAKIEVPDEKGITPLMYASAQAQDFGHRECLNSLLKAGAEVNGVGLHQRTVLMNLVELQYFKETKLVLEKGADVNGVDRDGYSALMLACCSVEDNYLFLELLIAYGANLEIKSPRGGNALSLAVQCCHVNCVRTLLKAGAKIDFLFTRDGKLKNNTMNVVGILLKEEFGKRRALEEKKNLRVGLAEMIFQKDGVMGKGRKI